MIEIVKKGLMALVVTIALIMTAGYLLGAFSLWPLVEDLIGPL